MRIPSVTLGLLLVSILIVLGCQPNNHSANDSAVEELPDKNELHIAVASNFSKTAEEIAKTFEELNEGVAVKISSGSSAKLTEQITNGAPFDLFLSADTTYPSILQKSGEGQGHVRVYAQGSLVITSGKQNKVHGIRDLLEPRVKKIGIPNPETAPYGRAAVEALKNEKIFDELEPKIVYGESVGQVDSYMSTGQVDAAFTSRASALDMMILEFVSVPETLYSRILQGIITTKHGLIAHGPLCRKFSEFLMSPRAVTVIERHGYQKPPYDVHKD